MFTLYGDGIHDDAPAIQELIDSAGCELTLPAPKKHYLIGKSLVLPSHFALRLPRYAEIRLVDGANCPMVTNLLHPDYAERLPDWTTPLCRHLWHHVNAYSPDIYEEGIEITGGIWNFNNLNQLPNPEQSLDFTHKGYTGDGMFFYCVRGLRLAHMTFKDPVHYGATFDRVSDFTIEDIAFDYNYGNPVAVNMDGVHFNGNCHDGVIRNLKGACYDDLVALNAHEGSRGPITNVLIDGLFAEDCHSAVRLLTVDEMVSNITIQNVYGSYYQYCIGLSKYYPGESALGYDAITIENIYARKAPRYEVYQKGDSYVYPLIWVQDDVVVRNLTIRGVHRRETDTPVETVYVGRNTPVESMILEDVTTTNTTGEPMPLLVNLGRIESLHASALYPHGDPLVMGDGEIVECRM
ncbi:MAG: hypothetical protein IKM13_13755 [Clostridia bacterium]|nr:hypothetical protein [Clostridia bacterium]